MARRRSHREVISRRLRAQRLSSGGLTSATDVVRLLTCVQSQESTYAPYSLGLRMRRATQDSVLAELSTGAFVRTHILRPTWHYVAAEDLRWIQAATAGRVLATMAGRHASLGIDAELLARIERALFPLLAERSLTRPQITEELAPRGIDLRGERLAHVLGTFELRALICSGPQDGATHAYQLVDRLPDHGPTYDQNEALRELAIRFFHGHGPASAADFARWASLTKTQAAQAIDDASDVLEPLEYADAVVYVAGDDAPPRRSSRPATMLLPLFDEALLTSPDLTFEHGSGHPLEGERFPWMAPNPGAGIVLHEGRNVGRWIRRYPGAATVRIALELSRDVAPDADSQAHAAITDAVRRYADFLGRSLVP